MSLAKINALFCFFLFFCVLSCFAEEAKVDGSSLSNSLFANNNPSSPDLIPFNAFPNAKSDEGNDPQKLASVPASLPEKAKDENKEEEKTFKTKDDEENDKKLVNEEEEDLHLSFLDTLLDMLSVFDSFSDYYFGDENFDEDSLSTGGKVNLRSENENNKEEKNETKKIEGKESLGDKLDEAADKELEKILNSYVDSSASSIFSSFFPFFNDDEEYDESLSSSFSSLSDISDYLMGILNFPSLPYFFDTMFAPLVGVLYRNNDILGRITTAIDEKEKICIVNVDMSNLPSTAIMQTEVENDGTVMIYFSNGQTIISEGEKNISSSLLSSSEHANLRGEKDQEKLNDKQNEVENDNKDKAIQDNRKVKTSYYPYISTPDTVSAVYSTSTFSLDERCDASSDDGKAIIDNKILILKFPLKKKTVDEKLVQKNDNVQKTKSEEKTEKNDSKDIVKVYENDKQYMKSVQQAEEEIIKQFKEDEIFKEENKKLIEKREQLAESGPVPDPLYMDQQGIAKKKHIVPLVRVEEF